MDLDQVKAVQKLAYECVRHTRSNLREGMSEIDAAKIMENFFREKDHKVFFHKPFVWFGDRTNFTNFKRPSLPGRGQLLPHLGMEFLPTNRKLQNGMAVTLDVAPAVMGLAVDIGYSFGFGETPEIDKARRDLLALRQEILTMAKEKLPIKDLYRGVDRSIYKMGYKSCHDLYPLGVLGHKIGKIPTSMFPRISIMGFHPEAYLFLMKEMISGAAILKEDESRPMGNGLWAIEPHIGTKSFGVKFEEILVVSDDDIYWLDDELPHVTDLKSP